MTVRARAINKLHKGATIAEKEVQRSLRSYGNHFSAIVAIAAIVATTIAEIDQFYLGDGSDRCDHMESTIH